MLRQLIREGRLVLTDHDGKVYEYGPGGGETIAARLTDKGAAMHIAKDPRMGAGEAYTEGRLVIEAPHDIRDFVLFVMGQANRLGGGSVLKPKGALRRKFDQLLYKWEQNKRDRASANVVHHYGLTREFYELFLDVDRQYSMAFYREPGNSLERAQIDKKALIAAKLRLGPKPDGSPDTRPLRVLDIGCGWGGMGLFYNKHYGCEVLGVSLAPDQVKFANERAEALGVADKVKFQLIDYRDVQGPFDRISSVGMFEHVGARHYDEYFAKCNELLADDGIMLTHTIGRKGAPGGDDPWSRKYIFPGHHLPAMSEMVGAMERTRWEVADVEVLRYHYAYTLEEWYKRVKLHEKEIVELYDERFFRMWQFYLVGAEQSFRGAGMVNFQIQSVKRRDAVPMTRDYIIHEAARLSASEETPEWHLDPKFKVAAE
ncbi:cyclopropane-fatty-acyl-phospholipid synthase family protein [Novosphingobium sp. JCM 18896]|uniref:cyclopropane-fatty-acyl-phospholipid synthase family protein n=1 Tax=Novosphingobium sp. JCM 18896 TaxID=2989731 RepID=UPI0029CA19D6|nr:cyclopropane-fatty-acyl-phospholipid synthase family protein [Novosphingobium sp. JCM 18896]